MLTLLATALGIGLSTVLGAGFGLLLRNLPHRFNDAILGAAAGLMLAAAVIGLILPATECTEAPFLLVQVVAGVFAGALMVSLIDQLTPHLHSLTGIEQESHANADGISKVLLFVTAIAIHKFPEGLAVGVSFGTGHFTDVLTVAGSIGVQNIPEGMVIIAPLLAIGVSLPRTFLIALFIGLIEVAGTFIGYSLISVTNAVLPFALAFAGGMMLYVISDEMIPETHAHGYEKMATFALLAGFMFVVIFDVLLAGA